MQEFEVIVDFNGIIIFDCEGIQKFFSGIEPGTNLYQRFTTTDDGDELVKQGILIPIMGINDSIYRVIVRMEDEESPVPNDLIIVTNSAFPLHVTGRVVIADMVLLLDWSVDESWQDLTIPIGFYSVTINGFRKIVDSVVVEFGFEVVFTPADELPKFTGQLATNMQVDELYLQETTWPPCVHAMLHGALSYEISTDLPAQG